MAATDVRGLVTSKLPRPRAGEGLILILGCATALFLNHSTRAAGFNLSLADPLVVVTFIALAVARKAILPPYILVYFSVLAAVSVSTAVFVTPALFGTVADGTILADLAKLIVCLVYLVCGIGLASLRAHMTILRWFAMGTAAIAFAGVAMELTGVRLFPEITFYGNLRYRGLMVDPNYWAVLACSAIAFFARDRLLNRGLRAVLIVGLVFAILLSASKTGFISLVVLTAILLLERTVKSRRRVELTAMLAIASMGLVLMWNNFMAFLQELVERYNDILPQLNRISVLFNDPIGAVSEGGSGRSATWEGGLAIIESSPFLGVGIGSYPAVNDSLFGSTSVAHNTYLQIAAEWGLPLTLSFLVWLVILLARSSKIARTHAAPSDVLVLRDMIIVFLIGSMSLSLNNARMFWLFLGMMVFLISVKREPRELSTNSASDARVGDILT